MSEQFTPGQRLTLEDDNGTRLVATFVIGSHSGYFRHDTEHVRLDWGDALSFGTLRANGFRVTHIDGEPVPAAPILPSEPGWYLVDNGYPWHLNSKGEWYYRGERRESGPSVDGDMSRITRLVPEGENRAAIAREVIYRMHYQFGLDSDVLSFMRTEFGVTEQGS